MDTRTENNNAQIIGRIDSEFQYNHSIYGEQFYMADIIVERLSNVTDRIPIMVSERLIDVTKNFVGSLIKVKGQFRSFNWNNRLLLSLFAMELYFVDEETEFKGLETNSITLKGYLCKLPVYRKTPLGREIVDFLLAVNRPYGKTDYIPCICWGRNARFASTFEVGEHVQINGRIQSREYVKKLSETQVERRIAYEISVRALERLVE